MAESADRRAPSVTDQKLKAIYFPHTDIQSPTIIKNALLLWDTVETIVPERRWIPHRGGSDNEIRLAAELVITHRVPGNAEREAAHAQLEQLISDGIPQALLQPAPSQYRRWSNEYLIYPDKFLSRTWRLLEERGLARWISEASDYGVPSAFGFLMMSVLADACAGTQIQKITDRADAYSWIAQAHAKALGSQHITGLDVSQVAPAYDRLVAISLEVLDARAIPLSKLIEMRKRELRSGGSDYSKLRRRYLKALQDFVSVLGREGKSISDIKELERKFKEEIKDDLGTLTAELGLSGRQALLSKEVALSVAVIGGVLAAPIIGLTSLPSHVAGLGVIPLTKALDKYRGTRREILRKHTMSWLYLASRPAVPLY